MLRWVLVPIALLAGAATAAAAPSTLTLRAPAATSYGHVIEFAGRLSPAVAETPIRLYREGALVAIGRLRGDGTFRIPVQIGRPGAFHVAAGGTASKAVSVRVHPSLLAALVGRRVVGKPLTLVAELQPQAAGELRVRILRGGKQTLLRLFPGVARVSLGTSDPIGFRIDVETLARSGYAAPRKTLAAVLLKPSLSVGDSGPLVYQVARRLAELHYAVPDVSDTFSSDFVQSVYAFQKVQGLPRTGIVDQAVWERLDNPIVPRPRDTDIGDHIEIDVAHQVLYLVRGGEVAQIVAASTAGVPGTFTPRGRFAIARKVSGLDPSPLGILYDPMYFTGGYAIHGNPSVPPYPASHGCIRIPMWEIVRLFPSEPFGEPVLIY